MQWFMKLWGVLKSPAAMAFVALFGLAFGIFQTFFYEKRGELEITVDAVSRVFDIHQPVGGLEISYSGQNLRSTNQALWAVTFTVTNSGNAEIRKGDYDTDVPFGVQIVGGKIVDIPTKRTSIDYLEKNLKINSSSDLLLLSPVIFEPKDSVQISTVVLGPENLKPSIFARGKVAGIKTISVITSDQKGSGKSAWRMATEVDRPVVHINRIVIYGFFTLFGIVGLLMAILFLLEPFNAWLAARKRRQEVGNYMEAGHYQITERVLMDLYRDHGAEALHSVSRAIKTIKNRNEFAEKLLPDTPVEKLDELFSQRFGFKNKTTARLFDQGILSRHGLQIQIHEGLEQSLLDFATEFNIDLKPSSRTTEYQIFAYERAMAEQEQYGLSAKVTTIDNAKKP
jgi:hypothetical protein